MEMIIFICGGGEWRAEIDYCLHAGEGEERSIL